MSTKPPRTIYEPVLLDHYEVVYVDLDNHDEDEVERAIKTWRTPLYGGRNSRIEHRRTTRGHHLRLYPSKSVRGDFVLDYLLLVGADPLFIRRFLKTGSQTLFRIRRGVDRGDFKEVELDE